VLVYRGVGDGVLGVDVGDGVTGVGVGDGVVGVGVVGVGDGVVGVGVGVGVVGVGVGVSGIGCAKAPLGPSRNQPTRTAQLRAAQLMIVLRVGLVLCMKLASPCPGANPWQHVPFYQKRVKIATQPQVGCRRRISRIRRILELLAIRDPTLCTSQTSYLFRELP
jgi:hypothetical protein